MTVHIVTGKPGSGKTSYINGYLVPMLKREYPHKSIFVFDDVQIKNINVLVLKCHEDPEGIFIYGLQMLRSVNIETFSLIDIVHKTEKYRIRVFPIVYTGFKVILKEPLVERGSVYLKEIDRFTSGTGCSWSIENPFDRRI